MTFRVIVDPEAQADLLRLYGYLLERAEYVEDLDTADRALQAIEVAIASLAKAPFLFRKVAGSRNALRRELVIPFGASGYVLKYEIASPQLVVVLAVRHQHETDYQ
jgi:plasmid stabilization system protein ParE